MIPERYSFNRQLVIPNKCSTALQKGQSWRFIHLPIRQPLTQFLLAGAVVSFAAVFTFGVVFGVASSAGASIFFLLFQTTLLSLQSRGVGVELTEILGRHGLDHLFAYLGERGKREERQEKRERRERKKEKEREKEGERKKV